jgi:hypothetical protein
MMKASLVTRVAVSAMALGLLCAGVAQARSDVNAVTYKETFQAAPKLTTGVWADGALVATTGGWYAAGTDMSVVTNIGGSYGTPPTSPIESGANGGSESTVLKLSTDVGTLTNVLSGGTFSGAANVWMDTLVQMVPSDDYPTAISNDVNVKAAIFLNVASNLVIYHGTFNVGGGDYSDSMFTVTSVKMLPGQWYRVTIQMDATTSPGTEEAFRVLTNGIAIASASGYTDNWKNEFAVGAPPGGAWHLTAARRASGYQSSYCTEVKALCFQGTGYIDDLVMTSNDPFQPLVTYWTLSVASSGNGTNDPLAGYYQVKVGDSTNVVATANDWYRINSMTSNGVEVAGSNPKTYTLTMGSQAQNSTGEVIISYFQPATIGGVSASWQSQWGSEAEVNAGDGDTFPLDAEYRLNTDPTANNTYTLEIQALTISGTTVTVQVKRTVTGPYNNGINGYLKLYSDADLTQAPGFAFVAGQSVTGICFFGDVATFTFTDVDPAKFYKAQIE